MKQDSNPNELKKKSNSERLLGEGKERFLIAMENQLQVLDTLFAELEQSPNRQGIEQWYRIAHTMKGSAPIFGLHSIGQLANSLLMEWEWTQNENASSLNAEEWASQAAVSLHRSEGTLRQLRMERDIQIRESQLSLQKEQGLKTGHLLENSRILLVDDDPILRTYLLKRLELDGYIAEDAADVETAETLLHDRHYDLILLDLMMQPKSGYELFEFLQEDPSLKWVPLIVLSARDNVKDKISCLMLGASDYITKPFRYEELAARIYSLLNRTKNFEQMAFRDPLTGVYNRRYFDHHIELELQRTIRYPAPITIAFIDIDRFKSVNDTFGHAVGDHVLQGLSHLVQQRLRNTDVLARFGGEEFVILLPNTTADQALLMLSGVLQHTRMHPIAQLEGQKFFITFSAGIAEWVPGTSIPDWLRTADEAMYSAKQQGRNQIVVARQKEVEPLNVTAPAPIRKRVLIADDDNILRSIVATRLVMLPIDVIEVSDGDEAYRYLLQQSVDLCILDGIMPNMDGFTLLQKLKSEPTFQTSPMRVMMLSGRKREEDVARGLELGADDYMSKPFSPVELEVRVRRLLDLE